MPGRKRERRVEIGQRRLEIPRQKAREGTLVPAFRIGRAVLHQIAQNRLRSRVIARAPQPHAPVEQRLGKTVGRVGPDLPHPCADAARLRLASGRLKVGDQRVEFHRAVGHRRTVSRLRRGGGEEAERKKDAGPDHGTKAGAIGARVKALRA